MGVDVSIDDVPGHRRLRACWRADGCLTNLRGKWSRRFLCRNTLLVRRHRMHQGDALQHQYHERNLLLDESSWTNTGCQYVSELASFEQFRVQPYFQPGGHRVLLSDN